MYQPGFAVYITLGPRLVTIFHHGVRNEAYRDVNGDSGISAYEYGDDWIKVQFKYGGTYEYQSAKVGSVHIANMKRLADSGDGLNAYINTNSDVKTGYSSKS